MQFNELSYSRDFHKHFLKNKMQLHCKKTKPHNFHSVRLKKGISYVKCILMNNISVNLTFFGSYFSNGQQQLGTMLLD